MHSHVQHDTAYDVKQLRLEAGRWLKQLREARSLSQRELARRVGLKFYTFVSRLELGRTSLSPDKYKVWAEALGVDPHSFVKELLRYYDPVTHHHLFQSGEDRPAARPVASDRDLHPVSTCIGVSVGGCR
jgi:transcriptional regulator with XRE-family HTH domain